MNSDFIKARWDECLKYESRRKKFQETHKEQKCCICGEKIQPGETIWCEPLMDKIYCSTDCYAIDHNAVYLDFEEEGYESLFDIRGGRIMTEGLYEIVSMMQLNNGKWVFTARPLNSEISFECDSKSLEDELFKNSQESLWLHLNENQKCNVLINFEVKGERKKN